MFLIESTSFQLECILRVVTAALCGACIGLERKNRLKDAGTRTHLVVCFASAVFIVISKYGFFDIVEYGVRTGTDIIRVDASRIASQIVTGIGFLGAGTIFVRRQVVNGLTTAAGLWATSALGMALGAGQYILGIAGTVILVFFQWILHKVNFFNKVSPDVMTFKLYNCQKPVETLKELLSKYEISIQSVKIDKSIPGEILVECLVKMPKTVSPVELSDAFSDSNFIKSVEF